MDEKQYMEVLENLFTELEDLYEGTIDNKIESEEFTETQNVIFYKLNFILGTILKQA